MKQRMFVLPVVALVALFSPALGVAAQADPVSILQQFINARNQADEPGAMALVADDMSYVGGSACPLANPCIGPQAIRAEVRLFISDHSQSILIGSPQISGTSVTARAETSNDAVRASGLDRVVYNYTVDVQDGKLTNLRDVQDASDPQTASFQAFQRVQQPNSAAISTRELSAQSKDAWHLEPKEALRAPAVSAQVRDTWYLERRTAVNTLAMVTHVADRWYLEPTAVVNAPAPVTHVADRWYLEPTATVSAPAPSNQTRDTWYLER
jgi:hypothetical protein